MTVVTGDLTESLVRYLYMRRLAFDDHERAGVPVEHHDIGALFFPVFENERIFYGNMGRGVPFPDRQKRQKQLPDVFFGRVGHPFSSHGIEYFPVSCVVFADFQHAVNDRGSSDNAQYPAAGKHAGSDNAGPAS